MPNKTGLRLVDVARNPANGFPARLLGALIGAQVKQAATQRVFGFEIMPAPFVVAHLQVGLTMQGLDAPLAEDGSERAGVFLTNALTGWDPVPQKPLPFPELAEERDRAEQVKQDTPVLVILGNPPYNGFAGVAVDGERELSEAYRSTKQVRKSEGRGLNDLYVRFFRMAERRIAEKTGRGVVCFISNYSWLDGQSFTGMRERYLEVFDVIRIDCLNGDKYKTGKTAPDGSPDPSIFSTPGDPVGIQVGTAISTLVRKPDHAHAEGVDFRHLWGQAKLSSLTSTSETESAALYDVIIPQLPLGLPFAAMVVGNEWQDWPSLPDLFPATFPGVTTGRDAFLIDVDLELLKVRVADYFNSELSNDQIAHLYPSVMDSTRRFDAVTVRNALLQHNKPDEGTGFIRYAYRPLDYRWLYWEAETKLLDEKRAEYKQHIFDGNSYLVFQRKARPDFSPPLVISAMGDFNQMNSGVYGVPLWLRDPGLALEGSGQQRRPNLSPAAQHYLDRLGLEAEDLFYHSMAVLYDPAYREANAGALRMEWPRIPLPCWPDGDDPHAVDELTASADKGRKLAALLDPDTPVPGVTTGLPRPDLASISVPATSDGHNMASDDFALTAGWGHLGNGDAVMPGQGRAVERLYSDAERESMGDAISYLGATTFDVYLNDKAHWHNVPSAVWNYKLGGYQVLKKWLSYRESKVLGRPLLPDEIKHFTDTARRIAVILELVSNK